jgi:hypothetical protein
MLLRVPERARTDAIRDDVGSSIHYRLAVGPFHLEDKTTIRFVEPGRHLQLETRNRAARRGAPPMVMVAGPHSWGPRE